MRMLKTKLVYVLTSSPENNYIEQALISVYSARYHNPSAYIVLIVDNLTDQLLVGKRSEILRYISEKVTIECDPEFSPMLRSRWIKTSVRNIIKGDFLFIDCDTIITRTLHEIDDFIFELGAVPESHLPVNQLNRGMYEKVDAYAALMGWNLSTLGYYFSSGVIYAKDNESTRLFYKKWNHHWLEGIKKGVKIDQPSFAKANIECGNPIQKMDDIWNCVMYTHPLFDRNAKILHFCSYQNMSYVFTEKFLKKIQNEGITDNPFIIKSITNPYTTYIPFDNAIYHYRITDYMNFIRNVKETTRHLTIHHKAIFDDYLPNSGIYKYIIQILRRRLYLTGALFLASYKFYRTKLKSDYKYVSNACAVDSI
jgi:hypothetical protein